MLNWAVPRLAYLLERFPSFGQHFIYREVQELRRQALDLELFSIRAPQHEPAENWDADMVRSIRHLPEEKPLVAEVDSAIRRGQLPQAVAKAIREWGRQTDFLRLYQAAYAGMRMREAGVGRVHAHFAGMAARTAYWIREFFGIEYSFTAHANDIFAPRDFAITLKHLIDSAAAVVTVSDFAARALRERVPDAAARIHRVYNGVNVGGFPTAAFDQPVPKILSVGRLIEKKGFIDLIDACGLLDKRGTVFTAEIIGEGPLQQTLRSRIAAHGLDNRVTLAGPLPQDAIACRLTAATLFVLPCKTESSGGMDNLPTVIMEAMAAALPVISTPVAGVPEMVEHNRTGVLVPEGDVSALSSAMAELLENRPRSQQLGARGRDLALQKFSVEQNVSQLRRLLGV